MEFQVDEQKCVRCGECVTDCPINILAIGEGLPFAVDERKSDCVRCLHCFAVCPVGAVSIDGLRAEKSQTIGNCFPAPEHMEQLIRGRRSIRRYRDENIESSLIEHLIYTVSHAPTGRNAHQVHFSVVDDREVMAEIRIRTMELLEQRFKAHGIPPGYEFYGDILRGWREFEIDVIFRWAPHLLITSVPDNSPSAEIDPIISLSYFDLLAPTYGIGTLWNGMVKLTMELVPELREMVQIPEHHRIGYFMSFGRSSVAYSRVVDRGRPLLNRVFIPVTSR